MTTRRGDILDWLALDAVAGVGPRIVQLLLEHFPTPAAILQASRAQLEVVGLKREVIENLLSDSGRELAEKNLAKAEELGATILTLVDEAYPALLKTIYDPPPALYVKGDLAGSLAQPCIAIVGSRHCSTYGRNAAELIAKDIAGRGVTVVSGLARGIDTAAHEGAIAAGGKTIAVFGTGLDTIYPKENVKLVDKILETGGAIITELGFNTPPMPHNFPFRNRIISGLSFGVAIVEAAERSGSLITARMAQEQNREVFAVPGNITSSKSFGPNYLIKDGAKLVQSGQDIIEELPREALGRLAAALSPEQPDLNFTPPDLTQAEKELLSLLSPDEPKHIDELLLQSKMGSADLFSGLFNLEMKDCIRQLPGKRYVKTVTSNK